MAVKAKGKPLPKAYTKVSIHFTNSLALWQLSGEAGGGKGRCVGSLYVGHPRVTIGHLRATMGHLRLVS